MIRLTKCELILHWGFDETRCCQPQSHLLLLHVTSTTPLSSLDGTPTLNQWILVEEGTSLPTVITIECSGLLVGSTSEEIADHIRASWATGLNLFAFAPKLINRAPCQFALPCSLVLSCLVVVCEGQHCLDLLRVELGPALAEVHVPFNTWWCPTPQAARCHARHV